MKIILEAGDWEATLCISSKGLREGIARIGNGALALGNVQLEGEL